MRKFLDITFGIILIVYILIINFLSSTRIAFSYPIIILGLILIFYHFAKSKVIESSAISKKVFKIFKGSLSFFLIVFLGIETAIINYPKYSEGNAEYILVLGAGLTNGDTPSLILQERLDAAIKCLEKNKSAYIVLSGGKGNDENLPESHAMSKYLQDKGIDINKIIIEDKSENTNENFKFSKKKIEEHSNKKIDEINVKIVTTDFHALRSSILARRNGYAKFDNYSSNTVWYLIPITYTREAFAIIKSLMFDK